MILGELVLHAAIHARPSAKATELVSYLVRTQPSLLDVKAANGVTPLMLAYRLGRLDAAKILIGAGADQTTKDRGRNNLLHAVLYDVPDAATLKPMLDLIDRSVLIPMLKERNRLEQAGQTPLHQYCSSASSYRSKMTTYAIRLIKMLIDLSPETAKHALKMLDGTGDTPLHTLLARDADPPLIHFLLDFDSTLLYCENAVGRTPAEVAHDRYLADNIKVSRYNTYRSDESVSSLVSSDVSSFVKQQQSCDEPKEHETKTTVAKNWRLCVDIMARDAHPKRTLVSLNAANFVAKRLGEKHTKDRYRFELVKKDEETAVSTDSQDDSSEAGNDQSEKVQPTAAPEEKATQRRVDVISSQYYNDYTSWARPQKEEGEGEDSESEEDEEEDDSIFPVCSKCGRRHY